MSVSKSDRSVFKWSGILLFVTALIKLYSATGSSKIFLVEDELVRIGYRPLMISTACVEIGVSAFLVLSESDLRRSLLLLWLSSNFLFYRLGTHILGVHLCPCLGNLTDLIPLPQDLVNVVLQFLVLYWFLTSLNILWQTWCLGKCRDIGLLINRIVTGKGIRVT